MKRHIVSTIKKFYGFMMLANTSVSLCGIGAPGRTRTPNLLIRSQTLYPIELRAQTSLAERADTTKR